MAEIPGSRTSRRACRVVQTSIRGLQMNLSDLSPNARGGDVFFSETGLFQVPHF